MTSQREFQEIQVGAGARLHVHATPKFKRTTVAAFLQHRLAPESVAAIGILPRVQRRGNRRWPTAMALERELTNLYGARLGTGVQKTGDRQLTWFLVNLPGDRYVSQPVLAEGLRVLSAVMFAPVVENGGLCRQYVEQEKQLQVGRIRSLINNKSSWAVYRCIQEMFWDEPFRLYELGTEEEVHELTPQGLWETHAALAREAPVDLYVVGDVQVESLQKEIEKNFPLGRQQVPVAKTRATLGRENVNTVVDEEMMGQGWLVLGFRSDIPYASSERFAMHFLNGILGGFVHSKLFVNVREKASLAYQASSGYDANKGYLLALAGIDPSKYDEALAIMLKQIDDIRKGVISEDEMTATRSRLLTRMRLVQDDPMSLVLQHLTASMEGADETSDEVAKRLMAVSKEDVVQVAERVRLDTVYFLKGVGNTHGG